jgi:Xaa-Pro aminopeptidase
VRYPPAEEKELGRIGRLLRLLSSRGLDSFLITDDINVSYLTGHQAHESWLLVTSGKVFYITDSRYVLEGQEAFKGQKIEVVEYKASISLMVLQLLKKTGVASVGLDERHVTMAQGRLLRKIFPKQIKLVAADGAVDELRMIKEPQEIVRIREAVKVNLEGYSFLKKHIHPGVTEQQLLRALEGFVFRKNVAFSFPAIIASGPNSAMPHARVSSRKLRSAEPLLVDMGIEKNSYKSDLTRMFFLGKMPPSYRKVLSIVRDAQHASIRAIRPGVPASTIDAVARKHLKKFGLDVFFGHSLGHGVGLQIHEMPRISRKSGALLEENMVFTVEPGVYFPGKFGIRLEEMVVVTGKGCEVLSDDCNH